MRLPYLLILMAAAACCAPSIKFCGRPGVITEDEFDVRIECLKLNVTLPYLDKPYTEAKVGNKHVDCGEDKVTAFIDNNKKLQFTHGKLECSGGKWHVNGKPLENTRVCCKVPYQKKP